MRFWPLIIACLGFSPSINVYAQVFEPVEIPDTISVVYKDHSVSPRKAIKQERLRFVKREQSDNEWLLTTSNLSKLPSFFKRFKVYSPIGQPRVAFTKKEALYQSMPLIDSQAMFLLMDTLFFRDPKSRSYLKSGAYKRDAERFFTGTNAGNYFRYSWVPVYQFNTESLSSLTIDVKGILFRKARYKTDKLPVNVVTTLPALHTDQECGDVNRFHKLRQMKGYGIDNVKYFKFLPKNRVNERKQFEIYFDANSAEARLESLNPVISYLKSNNYNILNATVEGYSSIEGTVENNVKLQAKRAKVLIGALSKYNTEPILSDTVIIGSGFSQLRQQIKNSPYQWLDSLTDEALVDTVNSNAILKGKLEPFLKLQRKAILKIVVAKRLEPSEIVEFIKRDFSQWEKQLDPRFLKTTYSEVESHVMGILFYLENLKEKGTITTQEYAEVIDGSMNSRIIRVLAVYHEIKQFESLRRTDTLAWESYVKDKQYNSLFFIAQSNLMSLILDPVYSKQQERFKRMLVDIQTYTFDYVKKGWLSVGELCAMDFPEHIAFRGFKLNHLAFLQGLLLEGREVPCERIRVAPVPKPKRYQDQWIDEHKAEAQQQFKEYNSPYLAEMDTLKAVTGITSRILTKAPDGRYFPSFGTKVESSYLYYLKKLFVNKESTIKSFVISSDSFYELDLATLTAFHVERWDPFINYFEDFDVQLLELNMLISKLKTVDKRLCTIQTEQLYLDYHLKGLHYLQRYFSPGNVEQVKIVQASLNYITQYYIRRSGSVTPKLSIYILHQLNGFNNLPGDKSGSWFATQLLNSIASKRILSSDEQFLLEKYNTHFNKAESSKKAVK